MLCGLKDYVMEDGRLQTKAQRMALIRKAHQRHLRRIQEDFDGVERQSVDSTGLHYNDARRYAGEYYGDVARATTRFDHDWD